MHKGAPVPDKKTNTLFDQLLSSIIKKLPPDISKLIDQIPIIVEDEPSKKLLKELDIKPDPEGSDLCGLHSGIALPDKSVMFSNPTHEEIFLFRGPIIRLAGKTRKKLEKEIRMTLLHEIAHHFGLSEERLEELGYD